MDIESVPGRISLGVVTLLAMSSQAGQGNLKLQCHALLIRIVPALGSETLILTENSWEILLGFLAHGGSNDIRIPNLSSIGSHALLLQFSKNNKLTSKSQSDVIK